MARESDTEAGAGASSYDEPNHARRSESRRINNTGVVMKRARRFVCQLHFYIRRP